MNYVALAILAVLVVGFAVSAILSFIASIASSAAKAIGEVKTITTVEFSRALARMRGKLAQRIGRAGQAGAEIEVFEPRLRAAVPERYSEGQLEECKNRYRRKASPVLPPTISVPTFPAVPDVLAVPAPLFRVGSTLSLPEDDIRELLADLPTSCSVPATLKKMAAADELAVPEWKPPSDFPAPPKEIASAQLERQQISLCLPLYRHEPGASALRAWVVEKLNTVVWAVHQERILAFQEEKERVQKNYEAEVVRQNAATLAYKCESSAWEAVKAEVESIRQAAEAEYRSKAESARLVYKDRKERYERQFEEASKRLEEFWNRVKRREPAAVCRLFNIAVASVVTPPVFPREWLFEYDAGEDILILDLRLPDFERIQITKEVALKRETKTKPVTVKEQKQLAETASCLYLLRVLHDVVHQDAQGVVKAVALNGWVEYVDATTGKDRSIVVISIFAEKQQLLGIDISRVDPVKCIASLGGRFAGIQHGYVAIAPIVRLNRHDDRVIEGSDILSGLPTGTNLAAMDWEEFEHLIRQLFEKVFSGPGIDVKVTRASRDRGVDAIVFDPDPIRGGKTVIQAKRYINTVDLSAVRDLYGTVVNEGANKGILVTTSSFGADAYEFSKDKNLTLLSGRELLGLLEQHGYHYRIDLEEARRMHALAASASQSESS